MTVLKADSLKNYRILTKNYSQNSFSTPFLGADSCDFIDLDMFYDKKILKTEFERIYNIQGIIGKIWDSGKNLTGYKYGSKNIQKIIEDNQKGLVSDKEAFENIEKYYDSQKKALDFAGDMASCFLGLPAFAFAVGTLGFSIPVALSIAGIAGGISKTVVKKADAMSAEREYKSFNYDIITGAINGVLSPVVTGLGNRFLKMTAGIFKVNTVPVLSKFAPAGKAGIVFCSKQKMSSGSLFNKIGLYLGSQVFKKFSKIGLASLMRTIAFDACSKDNLVSMFKAKYGFLKIPDIELKSYDVTNEM